ncbi:MAG: hypothetical protein AAB516_02225 [Patescibacteria group bacterium]
MTKQIIIAFILGIIVAVFGFHAYFVYQLREQVAKNTNDLVQIVNFLNQNTQTPQMPTNQPPAEK